MCYGVPALLESLRSRASKIIPDMLATNEGQLDVKAIKHPATMDLYESRLESPVQGLRVSHQDDIWRHTQH